jgi:hypothetical protein
MPDGNVSARIQVFELPGQKTTTEIEILQIKTSDMSDFGKSHRVWKRMLL